MNSKLQLAADLGKLRILAQEAVAGVNGLHVGDLGGRNQPGDVQIAISTCAFPMQMARSATCR